MKIIDLTGKKFGRLTVLKKNFPNDKWGNTRWLCRCSCGTEKVINKWNLTSGGTKSCGCLKKEISGNRSRINLGLASMHVVLRNYKQSAKKNNRIFKLTTKQFVEITQKDCYYCGAKPNNIGKTIRPTGDYIYNGLDRIDNTKGYTIDNVVPCCKNCNYAKSNLTFQEFKNWSERLYKKMFEIKD